MPERYAIQRQNISPFTVTQFGLTAFVRSPEKPNAYVAHPYNFYLCPPAFGRLDARFSCQASSLQFLRRYQFDFNKVRGAVRWWCCTKMAMGIYRLTSLSGFYFDLDQRTLV